MSVVTASTWYGDVQRQRAGCVVARAQRREQGVMLGWLDEVTVCGSVSKAGPGAKRAEGFGYAVPFYKQRVGAGEPRVVECGAAPLTREVVDGGDGTGGCCWSAGDVSSVGREQPWRAEQFCLASSLPACGVGVRHHAPPSLARAFPRKRFGCGSN